MSQPKGAQDNFWIGKGSLNDQLKSFGKQCVCMKEQQDVSFCMAGAFVLLNSSTWVRIDDHGSMFVGNFPGAVIAASVNNNDLMGTT